jgi:hypothetical protein
MLGDIEAQKASPTGPPAVCGLTLASPDFADGGIIPDRFSLANRNAGSPKLEWTNAPPQTVSFALILHDPDETLKKTTEDILHWLVFNFPGTARELPANLGAAATLPDGTIQAKSIRRTPGYMGPGADAPGPPALRRSVGFRTTA